MTDRRQKSVNSNLYPNLPYLPASFSVQDVTVYVMSQNILKFFQLCIRMKLRARTILNEKPVVADERGEVGGHKHVNDGDELGGIDSVA